MIEPISIDHPNTMGFRIEGKVTFEDIKATTAALGIRLQSTEKIRIYVEVVSLQGMEIKAVFNDIKFALAHFSEIEKEAIVSETRWLNVIASITNKLFSGLEVKHFSWEQKQQAIEWITG